MENSIETKEHLLYWINELIKNLNIERLDLTDSALYSDDIVDDNILNEMLEQTVKLQAYLEKLREHRYEE